MHEDVATTVLELSAVVLLALGLAAVATSMVGGGLLGYGVGLAVAALVLGVASAVLRSLGRPERDVPVARPRR